jgi:hypothetical protein
MPPPTYSRTDIKGNITVHAAPDKGVPLCGAGLGVDGYWRAGSEPVQCRRCLAHLKKLARKGRQTW